MCLAVLLGIELEKIRCSFCFSEVFNLLLNECNDVDVGREVWLWVWGWGCLVFFLGLGVRKGFMEEGVGLDNECILLGAER